MKKFMFACYLSLFTSLCMSTTTAFAAEESNAEKIVGTWKIVKQNGKEAPKEASDFAIEFTKDNKAKMLKGGKVEEEGTYKVDGNKLTVHRPNEPKGKAETNTIKSLTADTLILVDEFVEGKDKKTVEIELKRQ